MGTFHSGLSSAKRAPEAQRDNKRGGKGREPERTGLPGRGEQREIRGKVNKKAQELSCDFRERK